MKSLFLFTLLFITVLSCFAQINKQQLFYAQKSEKYGRMKNTGMTLTVAGGALFVIGMVVLANSEIKTNTMPGGGSTYTTTKGNPELGALTLLLGAGGLGSGIPLWVIGSHNEKKYQSRFETLSVGFNLTPQRTGLTLAYRF